MAQHSPHATTTRGRFCLWRRVAAGFLWLVWRRSDRRILVGYCGHEPLSTPAVMSSRAWFEISKKPEARSSGPMVRVCGARGDRQRPIVPQGCPCSIVGAGGLNDRVRDGNGCFPSAIVTNPPASHNSRVTNKSIPDAPPCCQEVVSARFNVGVSSRKRQAATMRKCGRCQRDHAQKPHQHEHALPGAVLLPRPRFLADAGLCCAPGHH